MSNKHKDRRGFRKEHQYYFQRILRRNIMLLFNERSRNSSGFVDLIKLQNEQNMKMEWKLLEIVDMNKFQNQQIMNVKLESRFFVVELLI